MLGFAIAEAVRFSPIAEYIEIQIEQNLLSFDITAPIQNKEGKVWYLEEHRGSGTINTMTELTMKKLKTSWKATDDFNKYHLKDPIVDHFTTPVDVLETVAVSLVVVAKQISSSADLLTRIKKSLEIDLDLSPLVDNLSIALNAPKQQDPIELIRKSVNSHHEMVNKCQNDLQNLEAMHEEAIADYTNNQDEIKRREKQNKKVSTKLLDSEGFLTNFLEAIDTTIELTKIQRNMHQQLFDLTKVALHTELAVPYPFHPDPTGREGVVSLNTTDNIDAVSTEETKPKGKGSCKKHKVSSRSSGNDDPDNDQDREAIIENKRDTNEQTSYYNLANYYFGWIYQLPKWLQSTLLNSRPIKEFIKTLNYNNRFVEKPTTLEKDLCAKLSKTQDHEYEYNFNQKVQINYDDNFNPFELTTIRSAITIGLILPIFMEQKDPLLGLGNNFIEI